ncbi:MAG: hypothetical protein ACREI7_03910 [Myxococcota bacterium]
MGVVPELGLGAGDPELAAGVYLPLAACWAPVQRALAIEPARALASE